jgi:hypothetical protein
MGYGIDMCGRSTVSSVMITGSASVAGLVTFLRRWRLRGVVVSSVSVSVPAAFLARGLRTGFSCGTVSSVAVASSAGSCSGALS